jgi:hypothetical protein
MVVEVLCPLVFDCRADFGANRVGSPDSIAPCGLNWSFRDQACHQRADPARRRPLGLENDESAS